MTPAAAETAADSTPASPTPTSAASPAVAATAAEPAAPPTDADAAHPMRTRARDGIVLPNHQYGDYITGSDVEELMLADAAEPDTFAEAENVKSGGGQCWMRSRQ